MSSIRPIVIAVAVRDDCVLTIEGFDAVKGERFYRPPGGGIDFGATRSMRCYRPSRAAPEGWSTEPVMAGVNTVPVEP